MAYFSSADDYKQFFELSGVSAPSDDYSHLDSVAGGSLGSGCSADQDCGTGLMCQNSICDVANAIINVPVGPSGQTVPVEAVVVGDTATVVSTNERFSFNRRTGKFEPFRSVRRN